VSKKYAIQFNHERNILGYHCDVVTFSANTPLFYKDCTFCHKCSGRHIYTISDLHFIWKKCSYLLPRFSFLKSSMLV